MIQTLTRLFPLWAVLFSIFAFLFPGGLAQLSWAIVPLLMTVQQVAVARGATANRVQLSTGTVGEVTAALGAAIKAAPEGMQHVIAVGGVPLQQDAWEALHTLLDDNKQPSWRR